MKANIQQTAGGAAVPSSDLQPCPFCGGEPYEEQFPTMHVIGCKTCAYSHAGKGIMSDVQTEPCGNGLVMFVAGGTLEHQTLNRAKWNTRWQANMKLALFILATVLFCGCGSMDKHVLRVQSQIVQPAQTNAVPGKPGEYLIVPPVTNYTYAPAPAIVQAAAALTAIPTPWTQTAGILLGTLAAFYATVRSHKKSFTQLHGRVEELGEKLKRNHQ
jgi:hypothetical protein